MDVLCSVSFNGFSSIGESTTLVPYLGNISKCKHLTVFNTDFTQESKLYVLAYYISTLSIPCDFVHKMKFNAFVFLQDFFLH